MKTYSDFSNQSEDAIKSVNEKHITVAQLAVVFQDCLMNNFGNSYEEAKEKINYSDLDKTFIAIVEDFNNNHNLQNTIKLITNNGPEAVEIYITVENKLKEML